LWTVHAAVGNLLSSARDRPGPEDEMSCSNVDDTVGRLDGAHFETAFCRKGKAAKEARRWAKRRAKAKAARRDARDSE
jgi:hypothetical protein